MEVIEVDVDSYNDPELAADPYNLVSLSANVAQNVQLWSVPSLKPGRYLNDEVFEFGMTRAFTSFSPPGDMLLLPLYFWNSYFFDKGDSDKHVDKLYKALTRLAPEKNLLKIKYLIMCSYRQKHWFMVVICNPFVDEQDLQKMEEMGSPDSQRLYTLWGDGGGGKRPPGVFIFDSIADRMEKKGWDILKFYQPTIDVIRKEIMALHRMFWNATGRKIEVEPAFGEKIIAERYQLPGQRNAEDCGLFCMKYLKMWGEGMKGSEGDYLSLLLSKSEYEVEWRRYHNSYTREKLMEEIIEDCANFNPKYLPCLKNMKRQFFSQV